MCQARGRLIDDIGQPQLGIGFAETVDMQVFQRRIAYFSSGREHAGG
jgi:hypothetical protein